MAIESNIILIRVNSFKVVTAGCDITDVSFLSFVDKCAAAKSEVRFIPSTGTCLQTSQSEARKVIEALWLAVELVHTQNFKLTSALLNPAFRRVTTRKKQTVIVEGQYLFDYISPYFCLLPLSTTAYSVCIIIPWKHYKDCNVGISWSSFGHWPLRIQFRFPHPLTSCHFWSELL